MLATFMNYEQMPAYSLLLFLLYGAAGWFYTALKGAPRISSRFRCEAGGGWLGI